ncbi:MAG: hypothetical protein KC561_19530, partial [Myxococcales bacterium]|nr:hypothetical protein [Myxococcales bacterium]
MTSFQIGKGLSLSGAAMLVLSLVASSPTLSQTGLTEGSGAQASPLCEREYLGSQLAEIDGTTFVVRRALVEGLSEVPSCWYPTFQEVVEDDGTRPRQIIAEPGPLLAVLGAQVGDEVRDALELDYVFLRLLRMRAWRSLTWYRDGEMQQVSLAVEPDPTVEPWRPSEPSAHEGETSTTDGFLGVSSSPRGIIVVDGVATGEMTPHRRMQLPVGEHIVAVCIAGGVELDEKSVLIRAGVSSNIFFRQRDETEVTEVCQAVASDIPDSFEDPRYVRLGRQDLEDVILPPTCTEEALEVMGQIQVEANNVFVPEVDRVVWENLVACHHQYHVIPQYQNGRPSGFRVALDPRVDAFWETFALRDRDTLRSLNGDESAINRGDVPWVDVLTASGAGEVQEIGLDRN